MELTGKITSHDSKFFSCFWSEVELVLKTQIELKIII